MKIAVVGGSGFIGRSLCEKLVESGRETTVISRSSQAAGRLPGAVKHISADTTIEGEWQEEIGHQEAVINLAGAGILRRWNEKAKQLMYDSRILTTRNLVNVMQGTRNKSLINASAVGYYGFHGDEEITEKDPPGEDFLAVLCRDWEKEAIKARDKGVRVATARFGVVLGKGGGTLTSTIFTFKCFVGGKLGSGEQWLPWVSMDDLVQAILFILSREDLEGPFNITAPYPVRNREFTKTLAQVLHRPAWLPNPAFGIRLLLGELGSLLLEGQRAVPRRLLDHEFRFLHPRIREALEAATT